jgi:DNA-binding YbaB/EbfC family protein
LFKGLSNLASMMKQAQQMGSKMQEVQEQLKNQRATGAAGGGMVEVEVNGNGEMLRLSIDPALIERGEREMLEDLIPAAANQANAKAKQLHAEAMTSVTQGMNLPGLDEAMSQITGGEEPGIS